MQKFDLCIIGGGPAGYLAAERAAAGGMSVVLFEKKALGGVCLNEGCIPTKTLLHSAKLYSQAKNGRTYGVNAESVSFDHEAVLKRKAKVVRTLTAGVSAKLREAGVSVVNGRASVVSNICVQCDGKEYHGANLLLATGSKVSVPPIPGLKEGLADGSVLTSREILDLASLPKSLAVIGGGVVGLEMAAYFATVGVPVTVFEAQDRIGGYIDGEIAQILRKELAAKGVDLRLGTQVSHIKDAEGDVVLLSVGRVAVTCGLGLENIGVYTEKGAVVTDENLRTNVPGVYAAGDVNGKMMLAHTAYREAEVAVNHMLGKKDEMRYGAVPSVIYTSPEVACVGETEESAVAGGLHFTVKKLSMRYAGRFVAETDRADGLCKLLIEQNSNRLIGAHLIGNYASEIIYGAGLMIESRRSVDFFKEMVFPHPTVSEIIRETLFS